MDKVLKMLKHGVIVIHNTDTCLGMAVDILNEDAVKLLYNVKRMNMDKPVSILCSDIEMAKRYGVFSEKALELADMYLPGALTLIVPRTKALPVWINPGIDSIGIRIPDDEFSLSMVRSLGNPVTTTSCNISGQKVCTSKEEVEEMFAEVIQNENVIIAFDGRSTKKVSTIVKIDGDNVLVVRQGEVVV